MSGFVAVVSRAVINWLAAFVSSGLLISAFVCLCMCMRLLKLFMLFDCVNVCLCIW